MTSGLNQDDRQPQIEMLMNELLPFAEKMLREHGGFHPFGGYLDFSEKVVHVGVQLDTRHATEAGRAEMLVESFKQHTDNEQAIALAIATDVTLPNQDGSKADAIRLFLEHRAGYCAEVFFRYSLHDGVVEISDTIAQQGDPLFFRNQDRIRERG